MQYIFLSRAGFFCLLSFVIFLSNCKEEPSQLAIGNEYSIATDHPISSQVGLNILDQGGNVVDAFVASSFAISVVRPQSTGLGGGGFALVHLASDKNSSETLAYDFRERAPALAHSKMYLNGRGEPIEGKSLFGYSSVGVPGMVKGLWEIHSEHGVLEWEKLVEPAIRLAEDGFPMYKNLSNSIEKSRDTMNPGMKEIFWNNGVPWKEGDILRQKELAQSLKSIQRFGEKAFYDGVISQKIHKDMKSNGGILRSDDLKNYRVKKVKPIRIQYRDYEIESFPLPSSAIFLFQILKILENYDLKEIYKTDNEKYSRLLIESMSEAFQDRAVMGGDPVFKKISNSRMVGKEIVSNKMDRINQNISKQRNSSNQNEKMSPTMESYNTTHITVMDKKGNIATSTHSVNYTLGSRVLVPGTGIILNDTMDDFSSQPGVPNAYGLVGSSANSIEPNKTPLSSMSPTIVYKNKKPWLSLGAPGGSFIFTSILNTIIRRIDLEESSLEAVANPRIHYQWKPDIVFVEEGWNESSLKKLDKNYNVKVMENKAKVFLTELREDGKVIAVSDPRGQGIPLAK